MAGRAGEPAEREERSGATRRPADLRREEILAATLRQVEEVGLAATRVGDVADALGVSSALVFYHFGTKDELLTEAFTYAVDRDLQRLDEAVRLGAGPVEQLRQVVRHYGPTGAAAGWRLWIDAWAVAQREPTIRDVLRRMDDRWQSVFRGIVDAGVSDGSFRCADPAASVARLSALLDGLSVATLVYRTVTRTQLRRWMGEAVATELGLPRDWSP